MRRGHRSEGGTDVLVDRSLPDLAVVAAKAGLVYVTALVCLRLAQRRTLAHWTIIDFAAALAVGAIVGRTATAESQSCATGAVALVSIVAAHRVASRLFSHQHRLRRSRQHHLVLHRVAIPVDLLRAGPLVGSGPSFPEGMPMIVMVNSYPLPVRPSVAAPDRSAVWDWLAPLVEDGTVECFYPKPGRGAVAVFHVDSAETLQGHLTEWAERVPCTFEVTLLVDVAYQKRMVGHTR